AASPRPPQCLTRVRRRPGAPPRRERPSAGPPQLHLSHFLSCLVTERMKSPPPYHPGGDHSSKWRWQPEALPVSPTSPIRCPVLTLSPSETSALRLRCM